MKDWHWWEVSQRQYILIFNIFSKKKTAQENALIRHLGRNKKNADTVKPFLVVSGIKRRSAFLRAEYVASLRFPLFPSLYSSEVAPLLNLL